MKLDIDQAELLGDRVRERVLIALLRAFSLGAGIIAGLAAAQAALEGVLSPSLIVGAGATTGLVALLQVQRRLHYRVTAILFMCQVWMISTYLHSFHGLTPSSTLATVAFILIAAMFLGLRAMAWILGATLLSLAASAVLVLGGWVEPWPDLLWDPHRPLVWLRYLCILLFLGGGLALAFAYLVRELESAARRASMLAAAQRAEQERRESIQDALEQTRTHEAIARFAGSLAHEFNDSLVAILALSHRIENDPRAPAHLTALAASIRLGVELAAETASGLLALSRDHANAPRVVALGPLLRRCEISLRRLLPSVIELVVGSDTRELVFADPHRLQQAIIDLALNARDAMPEGGRFQVAVQRKSLDEVPAGWNARSGSFVVITCSDTGAGMDKETLHRVFEPFFTTKPSSRSTGLGLAIVRGFIYDSSGFMEVQSELGRGSSFRLFLPRPAESAIDDEGPSILPMDAHSA